MKRWCLVVLFLLFVAGVGYLFAQDESPRRDRRKALRPMRLPNISTSAMEIDDNFAYCVTGTVVFKVSIDKMEVVAKQELEHSSTEQEIKPEDIIKKLDKDGDGKVTKEEFPNEELFERLDRDGNGVVTKEEIPEQLIKRMMGRSGIRRRIRFLSPPIIRFVKDKLVILLANTLYKLSKSDLSLEGAIQLEPEGMIEPKRPKKEKKEEDFGF